jgi:hypothetical protein
MTETLERDLRARMSPSILAERWQRASGPFSDQQLGTEYMTSRFRMLHQAGVRKFRLLRDPPLREVSFSNKPTSLNEMTWKKGTGSGFGTNPSLTFTLSKPRFIYAIRLKYAYRDTAASVLTVSSKKRDESEFSEALMPPSMELEPEKFGSVTVWVNDSVKQFRIQPDTKPCIFDLLEIVFLVPDIPK